MLLRTSTDHIDWFAGHLARMDCEFAVLAPAALRASLARLGQRLLRAGWRAGRHAGSAFQHVSAGRGAQAFRHRPGRDVAALGDPVEPAGPFFPPGAFPFVGGVDPALGVGVAVSRAGAAPCSSGGRGGPVR
ncbi:WYL domain-containing protein [Massilia sp. H-1]|nr:WYL domain-containing protein [Massilia sp. H-1]